MPDRIIRAGILTSEAVNNLSPMAELFYRRLMSVADDHGRFDGRTVVLRASLFPLQLDGVRNSHLESWIGECLEARLVRCYKCVEDKPFIEIIKFGQRIQSKSKWPEPVEYNGLPESTVTDGDSPPIRSRSRSRSRISESSADSGPHFAGILPKSFTEETRKLWIDWAQTQLDARRPYTPISVGPVFREFEERGEAAVREALLYSIKNRAAKITWKPTGKATSTTDPILG